MKFIFQSLVVLFLAFVHGIFAADHTDEVEFDSHSLFIKGQRVFLHGGEFHTFRLPIPDLWIDILEKVKAAGLNSISVYTHMGLLNPSRGVVDFDEWRNFQPLFDAAKEAGIWITMRPGPYINAETTAGGIAHWITSEVAGTLRTNVSDYQEAWTPYIKGMASQIRGNEITDGGPVLLLQIDNEYNTDTGTGYMAQLESTYRDAGIVVPFTYNDAGNQDHFVNGTGAVDLHGNDYYPQRYNCADPDTWHTVVDYWDYHQQIDPAAPFYIPEMQGGSLNGWGPGAPQYSGCTLLTGPEFENVFYRQLWASNAKLISYYMFYGGTSWGALPYGYVYTSYDYGGTISESRALTPKHPEIKLQGIFLRSSREFYKTDRIGNSSIGIPGGGAVSDPSEVALTFLQNLDSGAGFWITRHNDSTSTAVTSFTLNVTTSLGLLHIPLMTDVITLSGRESKVIVTDYAYGSSSRMLYSTAQVFFAGVIDSRDVLFLYGSTSQSHEFALALPGASSTSPSVFKAASGSSFGLSRNMTVFSFTAPFTPGLVTVFESATQLILFADTPTAGGFFAPTIASPSSTDPHKNFWGVGTNDTVLIGGPYLVRSASIGSGSNTLEIRGDLNLTSEREGSEVTIVAPAHVTSATWNGQPIALREPLASGSRPSLVRKGTIPPPANAQAQIQVPKLSNWKFSNSLPEISKSFDDSDWTVANHTTTNIPFPMYYGDGRILYGCDYGFCENIVIWRGHFNATGSEQSVNLSINGGTAFAASVWLNDVFLNTSYGNSSDGFNILEETDDKFIFPEGALLPSKDNVITVVQDNMGLNETVLTLNDPKSPRGVRGFKLDSGNFSEWKVQGKIGGYTGYPDKVRGVLNEGGLFGERQGWHLPGFDTSKWASRALSSGLPDSSAGVGFFVTTFDLSLPQGLDIFVSFTFEEELGQPYRAYLFVNGWMLGKRVANLGPQFKFPVHEGILDYHGVNTVAVALWSMEPDTTISPQLELTVDGMFSGGISGIRTNNPSWSPEGRAKAG
ncbi:glycoside hydrolase family 35 protein [Collybiopsis luxurians FD-317 M1]|nr:glycoside hydrolase family 35 protein [Collybiopsis luxurians FD-317 M1]